MFIEGAQTPGPAALHQVAAAIASRYGLPVDAIVQRMSTGRFRVKSGIDRQTAIVLAKDLSSIGAMCIIVDSSGNMVARVPEPAPKPAAPSSSPVASSSAPPDLGALNDFSALDRLTLATVDGESADTGTTGPEEATHAAVSLNAFAPPEENAAPLALALAVEETQSSPVHSFADAGNDEGDDSAAMITDSRPSDIEPDEDYHSPHPARASRPLQRPSQSLPQPPGAARVSRPLGFQPPQEYDRDGHLARGGVSENENIVAKARTKLADEPRIRFAVGVFVALIIGFLPAILVTSIRSSALTDIDNELIEVQEKATDIEAWNQLDNFRASVLERKQSRQTNIAVSGIIVWTLCGGALAFLWFRKIDWTFYQTPRARAAPS